MADAPKVTRPLPVSTSTTQPYWEGTRAHKLRFQRCRRDAAVVFYPRLFCPKCGRAEFDWFDASGEGTIYSFTVVHKAPNEAFRSRVPYVVAIVETDEGVRMMTNIKADRPEELAIGLRVRVVFEDVTGDVTLPEFELLPT